MNETLLVPAEEAVVLNGPGNRWLSLFWREPWSRSAPVVHCRWNVDENQMFAGIGLP